MPVADGLVMVKILEAVLTASSGFIVKGAAKTFAEQTNNIITNNIAIFFMFFASIPILVSPLYTILCYNTITKPLKYHNIAYFNNSYLSLCLTASNATTPVATDAFNEFTVPSTGILTIKSHASLMILLMP